MTWKKLTLGAYHAMLDDAPPYFFAHTAWLIANRQADMAMSASNRRRVYKDRVGAVLSVVPRLEIAIPGGTRSENSQASRHNLEFNSCEQRRR